MMNTAIQYFEIPTVCPSCGASLNMDGQYLMCVNEDCEAQVVGMLKRWVSKLDIKHLGGEILKMLVEREMVSDIADLYAVDPDVISGMTMNGRQVGATADRGFANLHKKKTLPLHVFVGSLGIPLIGRSMTKTIVNAGFDSIDKMKNASVSEIAAIAGVGQIKAESFVAGLVNKTALIDKLIEKSGITVEVNDGVLRGQTFCLTGFRDADLVAALEKQGATQKSGVSRGLTFLIVQDKNSNSGKAKKARQYGVNVINVEDAKNLCE